MPSVLTIQIYSIGVLILSAVLHEYVHGLVADKLGDPTPRLAGRLTTNPLVHLDWWGSIMLPMFLYLASGGTFMFAYAKPVPFNPYNLRDQRWGVLKVAIAGIVANTLMAVVFGLVIRFLPSLPTNSYIALAIIVQLNLLLAVFNIIPVPPLDGSKVLFTLLPDKYLRFKIWAEQNSTILLLILLAIILFTGILGWVISGLFSLITGVI